MDPTSGYPGPIADPQHRVLACTVTDRECEQCARLWRDTDSYLSIRLLMKKRNEEAQKNSRDLMYLLDASLRAEEAERGVGILQAIMSTSRALATDPRVPWWRSGGADGSATT